MTDRAIKIERESSVELNQSQSMTMMSIVMRITETMMNMIMMAQYHIKQWKNIKMPRCSGITDVVDAFNVHLFLKKSPDLLGFLYNCISALMFSFMTLIVKLAGSFVGPFELVVARSIVQLVLCTATILIFGHPKRPLGPLWWKDSRISWLLVLRGFIGILAMCCYFVSLSMLQLGEGVLVSFLAPVSTAIWGRILLKESISALEIVGMVFALAGVILVARPPFIFGFDEESSSLFSLSGSFSSFSMDSLASGRSSLPSAWTRTIGVAIGVLNTIIVGSAYSLTRKIGKSVHPMVVVNWLSIMGILVPILPIAFYEGFVVPQGTQWLLLLALGVVAFLAQTTLTLALQTGTAGRVTVANYTQIVWAFIWGLVFLGEKPELTSLLGTLLIAVDAAFAVYKAWIKKPSAKKEDNKPVYDAELDEIEVVDMADTPELHEIGVSPSPDSSVHEHEADVKESKTV